MKEVYAVRCECNSNPDLDTTFYADEIKKNCKDLGIPEKDWMEYSLSYLFIDCPEWTEKIESVVLSPIVRDITITLGGDVVHIMKRY